MRISDRVEFVQSGYTIEAAESQREWELSVLSEKKKGETVIETVIFTCVVRCDLPIARL